MQIHVMVLQRTREWIYVFMMVLIDVMPIRLKPWFPIKIGYDFLCTRRTMHTNN